MRRPLKNGLVGTKTASGRSRPKALKAASISLLVLASSVINRDDRAAVLVMASDDAADGEAHGVPPSVSGRRGSFAGRQHDSNGAILRLWRHHSRSPRQLVATR